MVLTHLVRRGRDEGWIAGEPITVELSRIEDVEARIAARVAASAEDPTVLPMQWLGSRLRLSPREMALLWMLACIELSPAVTQLAGLFASEVTVQIVEQLVPISHAELDALCRRGLLEMGSDPRLPMSRRAVRASDRVIDLAKGDLGVDRELRGIGELGMPDEIAARGAELPEELLTAFDAGAVIVANGADGSGRATLLAHLAARRGVGTLRVQAKRLARDGATFARQARAIARECELFGVVAIVEDADELSEELVTILDRELVRETARPVLMTTSVAQRWKLGRAMVVHRVEAPNGATRERMWRQVLPGCEPAVIVDVASRYLAMPGTIHAAAAAAIARSGTARSVSAEDVHEGLRANLDERLADLATRVRCTQTWNDLVLPSDQLEQIAEVVARVRHRRQVLEDWGFADKVGRGVGIAALLSGPPGTGKTMVAGLIARELGLDLYQIDLSRIVSKYIGETEKNLARVFDAAEVGHAILLFDEADSLFAKRSEVKSSNDRYANLEVNFLLQRIEQFAGISLLTTNHERNIDEAFRRRLAIHVRFTSPDVDQREQLWRTMMPARARLADGVDYRRLAEELEMTGGYIKNAVVRAAYLAASEGSSIGMHHLWAAARAEYEAMGKLAVSTAA